MFIQGWWYHILKNPIQTCKFRRNGSSGSKCAGSPDSMFHCVNSKFLGASTTAIVCSFVIRTSKKGASLWGDSLVAAVMSSQRQSAYSVLERQWYWTDFQSFKRTYAPDLGLQHCNRCEHCAKPHIHLQFLSRSSFGQPHLLVLIDKGSAGHLCIFHVGHLCTFQICSIPATC